MELRGMMTPSSYGFARLMEPALATTEEIEGWINPLPANNFLRVYMDFARSQTPAHAATHVTNGLVLVGASAHPSLVARGPGIVADTYAPLFGWVVGETGSWKSQSQGVATRLLRASSLKAVMSARPASAEVLSKELAAQPHAVIAYPEFSTLLAATAGSDGMGSRLRVGFTDVFDGDSYETTGLRSGKFTVVNPRVSIFATCAPTHISEHTTQVDFAGGFVNRFLLSYSAAPDDSNWLRGVDPIREAWLIQWLDEALGRPVGTCMGMTHDAYWMWKAWRDDWMKFKATLGKNEQEAMTRTPLLAMRVALGAAWASTATCHDSWYLEPEHILTGIGAAAMHVASSRRLIQTVPKTLDRREVNAVFDAIRTDWTSLGEITRASHVNKQKVVRHIETLEGEGLLVRDSQNSNTFYRRIEGQPIAYDTTMINLPPPPLVTE